MEYALTRRLTVDKESRGLAIEKAMTAHRSASLRFDAESTRQGYSNFCKESLQ